MRKRLDRLGLLFAATIVMATLAAATPPQLDRSSCKASIRGTIVDSSGALAANLEVELWPLGVDMNLVLPRTRTNQNGKYLFEHICYAGRYSVISDDKAAGYDLDGLHVAELLYGHPVPEVTLSGDASTAVLDVRLPPKPALLRVRAQDNASGKPISNFQVRISVSRRRTLDLEGCDDKDCVTDVPLAFPPNEKVTVKIVARGFRAWSGKNGARTITAGPGETVRLDVVLKSLKK